MNTILCNGGPMTVLDNHELHMCLYHNGAVECGSLMSDDKKSHQVGGKTDVKFMNLCLTSP